MISNNQTSISKQFRRHMRQAMGIVELVMVFMVIGIMAAAAVPKIGQSLNKYRADAAARRVALDIQQAQSVAKRLGTSQTITFDTALHCYTLPGQRELDRNSGTYTVKLNEDPYDVTLTSAVFNNDGTTNAEDQSLVFDRFGLPDSGGTVRVTAGGIARDINVNSITGLVTLP